MILIITMLGAMLLASLSGALALTAMAERQTAANYDQSIETFYAADAGVELAIERLAAVADWTNLPSDVPFFSEKLDTALQMPIERPALLVAWVTDDPAETDGQPSVDTNGTLVVLVHAYGQAGSRRMIEATVERVSGGVRVVAWRELRS